LLLPKVHFGRGSVIKRLMRSMQIVKPKIFPDLYWLLGTSVLNIAHRKTDKACPRYKQMWEDY
jgi:hypothetical protein